jgi:DNA-binding NtrC family response regulator
MDADQSLPEREDAGSPRRGKIVVLDDERDMAESCRLILKSAGYDCLVTTDPMRAISLLELENPDLLIADLRMPTMDGMDVLRRSLEIDPLRPVIIFTAFASIESAITAIKRGAFDYLAKPFSIDQLKIAVERAMKQRSLALENFHLREQIRGTYGFDNIVGASTTLRNTLELVRKAARSEASVLIFGESGTGKELIAHAIHANSPRSSQALIPIDCAALPQQLLESELFGYERGAFTGAVKSKPGLLELADGGTLFLDEIGELLPELQVKLLRVLQEHRIRRLGGTREISVDVRFVSATNRDLNKLISQNKFRSDLFYRLNVVSVHVPPLRERGNDILLLARYFLARFKSTDKAGLEGFAPEVIEALRAYAWPGNIRELQNAVEHSCALSDGNLIVMKDLPDYLTSLDPGVTSVRSAGFTGRTYREARNTWLSDFESTYAEELLRRNGGNISRAARAAAVDRKTFRKFLKRNTKES